MVASGRTGVTTSGLATGMSARLLRLKLRQPQTSSHGRKSNPSVCEGWNAPMSDICDRIPIEPAEVRQPVKKTGRNGEKRADHLTRFDGSRPGPGRPKGVQNKIPAEVRELAQSMSVAAMRRLFEIGMGQVKEATIGDQVKCLGIILERGCGKPFQSIGSEEGSHIEIVLSAADLEL